MRGLLFALLLLACVACLGLYLGWFDFSSRRDADGDHVSFHVDVDTGKIKADAGKAKEKAAEVGLEVRRQAEKFGEKAREAGTEVKGEAAKLAETRSVTGRVLAVDEANKVFTVETADHKEWTLHAETGTSLKLKGADLPLRELRVGDGVTVTYTVRGGKNVARQVTVERSA